MHVNLINICVIHKGNKCLVLITYVVDNAHILSPCCVSYPTSLLVIKISIIKYILSFITRGNNVNMCTNFK